MLGLIIRRLVQLPLILLVIYTLTLTLAWAIPGNPLESTERNLPPEVVTAMQVQYKLDNFWSFYGSYLRNATGVQFVIDSIDGSNARRKAHAEALNVAPPESRVFNLGPSLQYRDRNVNEIVSASLPVSVTIGATAMLIAVVIGVGAGVVGAYKPNSLVDFATLAVALIGISLPSFVIATVMLMVMSLWLNLLPIGGWGGITRLIMPAVTLSLPFAAYIARLTRLGMIENLSADYIRTARAKGVSERGVLLRHALKNAFLPVLSYLGPACALAMTGSFVVERVFFIPGLGQHFVNAVQNKDLFLLIGVVLVFATLLILLNLAVDVLYRWVDPRIQ
jgi:oligopeptide transport system permease protein